MYDLVVLPGLAPASPSSPRTVVPDAPLAASPNPFTMRFPALSDSATSLASARSRLIAAEAKEFYTHVKACADCVLTAMRADIESGALPLPLQDPKRVEEELYARATLQAHESWYARAYSNSSFATLLLAEAIPGYQSALFISAMDYSEALLLSVKGSGPMGTSRAAVLLHSGAQHRGDELGLGVSVDWQALGVLVVRNLILTALCSDPKSRVELKLNRTSTEKDRRSPVWVGAAPTITSDLSQTGRRRKRS